MDSYSYIIIAKTGKYTFTLFVATKDVDKLLVIGSITANIAIWGHKKKSCRCILRSFYKCVRKAELMRKEYFYRFYTIIKSRLIPKDLLIEKFPHIKQYELL